jgi:hypothetical protein
MDNLVIWFGLLFLALLICAWRLVVWLDEPRRNIERIRKIEELWSQRGALLAAHEEIGANLGELLFRAELDALNAELEALGVPEESLR